MTDKRHRLERDPVKMSPAEAVAAGWCPSCRGTGIVELFAPIPGVFPCGICRGTGRWAGVSRKKRKLNPLERAQLRRKRESTPAENWRAGRISGEIKPRRPLPLPPLPEAGTHPGAHEALPPANA